jgi:hypothetical protein
VLSAVRDNYVYLTVDEKLRGSRGWSCTTAHSCEFCEVTLRKQTTVLFILRPCFFFYILATVHLRIILINNQLNAQFLLYIFISILYMLRATLCSSSGESFVSIQHLVHVTLFKCIYNIYIMYNVYTRGTVRQVGYLLELFRPWLVELLCPLNPCGFFGFYLMTVINRFVLKWELLV